MPNKFDKRALLTFNAGFLSSRIGEWLYTLALNWLVLLGTSSPLLLAVINACRLLPALVLSVPAGKLADRSERKRVNTIVAVLNALVVALTGLVFYFQLPFTLCAVLVVARAAITAAEAPMRNALLCGVLSGDRLKSVVAQNASIMNVGRILGPLLAGFSLAHFGGVATFLIATVFCAGYAVALACLDACPVAPARPRCRRERVSIRKDLAAQPELSRLFIFALPIMFFGFSHTAMLPLFADLVLKAGAEELGYLMSISALGALLASSFLSTSPDKVHWQSLRRDSLLFGSTLTLFAFSGSFWAAALALFAVGFFGQAYRTSSRMMFQDLVPKEAAGRFMGLALMDRGMIPLGALFIGLVAEFCGARMGFVVMGLGSVISVLLLTSARGK